MSQLEEVHDGFIIEVDRIEHLLALIEGLLGLIGSVPASLSGSDADYWPEATKLQIASQSARTGFPAMTGSLLLYLCGSFEFFIRQVVEVAADELSAMVRNYSDLPKPLRDNLKTLTLEVAKAPKRFGFDEAQANVFLADLVACQSGLAVNIDIASSVLAATESNLRADVLADLLKRIALDSYWPEVGKQTQIKLNLYTMEESLATKEARATLDTMMALRNRIAHPSPNTQFPDSAQVQKAAKFLRVLAKVTVEIVQVHLAKQSIRLQE